MSGESVTDVCLKLYGCWRKSSYFAEELCGPLGAFDLQSAGGDPGSAAQVVQSCSLTSDWAFLAWDTSSMSMDRWNLESSFAESCLYFSWRGAEGQGREKRGSSFVMVYWCIVCSVSALYAS
ncbi:hypothetical protein EYF80_022027 [Liparis tanakae]|uniref:Uncharacterized protein n=1 Tax=Liparis tanakae TaxID=230148 RepID=A0A4Z2HQ64_9TELE|nr:hypothetical protein EYF80_022027 [Liparis tanakae]